MDQRRGDLAGHAASEPGSECGTLAALLFRAVPCCSDGKWMAKDMADMVLRYGKHGDEMGCFDGKNMVMPCQVVNGAIPAFACLVFGASVAAKMLPLDIS